MGRKAQCTMEAEPWDSRIGKLTMDEGGLRKREQPTWLRV